jgi:TatD DNase family protein
MYWIDTHTHLFAEEFIADSDAMIQRAIDANVHKMLLPNIDIDSIASMKDLAEKHPKHCFPMMGIHPCSVTQNVDQELGIIKQELDSGYKYYGIGEIGMDLYWDKTTEPFQTIAFQTQCEWAVERNLAISIHTRSAIQETLGILKTMKKVPQGVFHCFSGTLEEANEIIKLGFKLGIGGVVTYKNSSLPELLKQLSPEYLVMETDSPYLPPVPYRGKRNESSYIPLIAQKLADIYEIKLEEIALITNMNAEKLFLSH